MHGFLAEAAEAGIENARNLVKGLKPACEWLNNNGPVDLLRNGVGIQQKFVRAGGHFGLEAVKEHLEKYPDFLKKGGKYQLPKDFYDEIRKLLALPQEEAAKESASTYQLWKWIHDFFSENNIEPKDLEPAVLNYSDAQVGRIEDTIKKEESNIKDEDQKIRDNAYNAGKPSLKQGAQVTVVAAVSEGGLAFCLGVAKKLKQGKQLSEFTVKDWREVGIDTAKGSAQGSIRGASVYAMTNFTATSAAVANALVTAMFGITAQAYQLRRGAITDEDFITNSEILCLDVSISAIASLLGQTFIPIPVLGAVIGNVTGMFMYQIAKDYLSSKEQMLIQNFHDRFVILDKMLEERYQQLISQLKIMFEKYTSILEVAFDQDVNIAFAGSVELAEYTGVMQNRILKNKSDIDNYFLE